MIEICQKIMDLSLERDESVKIVKETDKLNKEIKEKLRKLFCGKLIDQIGDLYKKMASCEEFHDSDGDEKIQKRGICESITGFGTIVLNKNGIFYQYHEDLDCGFSLFYCSDLLKIDDIDLLIKASKEILEKILFSYKYVIDGIKMKKKERLQQVDQISKLLIL